MWLQHNHNSQILFMIYPNPELPQTTMEKKLDVACSILVPQAKQKTYNSFTKLDVA